MRIIPVLDLKSGQAVHAKGGDRTYYGPLASVFHQGTDPKDLYLGIKQSLGSSELYVADLDALGGKGPDLDLYRELATAGATLWLDAGVRSSQECETLLTLGVDHVILALESLDGAHDLKLIASTIAADRLAFSLDLREGRLVLRQTADWPSEDPLEIAGLAIEAGIKRLLLIDVGRVGMGQGVGTLPLLKALHEQAPEVELLAGGGISDQKDLLVLEDLGVSGALVGSALHDGRLVKPRSA